MTGIFQPYAEDSGNLLQLHIGYKQTTFKTKGEYDYGKEER